MSDTCACGRRDRYSRLPGRTRCATCQIRRYQQLEREQGDEAVVAEAIRMSEFRQPVCPTAAV